MGKPDIVEFAEKHCGIELLECQKELLRKVEQLPPGERLVVMPPRRQLYFDELQLMTEILGYQLLNEGEGNGR